MRGDVAGGTAFIATDLDGVALSPTKVIITPGMHRSTQAATLAYSTTDQGAQQVVMCLVVTPRKLFILGQLGLDPLEQLCADNRRNRGHRHPRFPRQAVRGGCGLANGMRRRTPDPRRPSAGTTGIDLARIDRIGR